MHVVVVVVVVVVEWKRKKSATSEELKHPTDNTNSSNFYLTHYSLLRLIHSLISPFHWLACTTDSGQTDTFHS